MVEAKAPYNTRFTGRVEREMQDVVSDMSRACFSVMASRGVLVGEKTRIDIMSALRESVTRSIEIEAAIVRNIETGEGPQAA